MLAEAGRGSSSSSRRPSSATAPRRDVTWLTRFDSNDAGVARGHARGPGHGPPRTARRRSGVASRPRSPSPSFTVAVRAAGRSGRGSRAGTTSSTSTSSPSSRPAHRAVRTCAPTTSSSAGCSSTPSACCRRPTRCGAFLADNVAGQAGEADRRAAGAAGVRRLLGAVPGRPVPEPQGARPRRARHEGRAGLPRLAAQAGGREPAVGRDRPRRADRDAARRARTRPSATTSSPSASTGEAGEVGGRRRRWPRRSSARASAAPQCHNHPLERYTQDDYYHFAAFFCRVKLDAQGAEEGPDVAARVGTRDPNQNKKPGRRHASRAPGEFMQPQPLDRSTGRRRRPATTRAQSWPTG